MAHYLHQLLFINRHTFICVACVSARWSKDNTDEYWKDYWLDNGDERQSLYFSFLQILYPTYNWLCIRYHYHLPFNILLTTIVLVIEPINYLYNFVTPGTNLYLFYKILFSFMCIVCIYHKCISGGEIVDKQWKSTLSIMNIGSMVFMMAIALSNSPFQGKIIPMVLVISFGGWIIQLCKTYFAAYVAPALD